MVIVLSVLLWAIVLSGLLLAIVLSLLLRFTDSDYPFGIFKRFLIKFVSDLPTGRWFSPGTLVSSANKTDGHDIAEILLKVAFNTINQTKLKLKTSKINRTFLDI
jgi:hypothetical protein